MRRGRHLVQQIHSPGIAHPPGRLVGEIAVEPLRQEPYQVSLGHTAGNRSKQLLAGCRNDEILQIERLEIGDVLRAAFVEGLLGEPGKPAGRRGHTASERMPAHLRAPLPKITNGRP